VTLQRGCSKDLARAVSRRRRRLQFGSNLAARRRSQVYDTDDHRIRDEPRLREATMGDFPRAHPGVGRGGGPVLSNCVEDRAARSPPRRSVVSASVFPRNFEKAPC